MKTSIHLLGFLVLLGAALAGCGMAEQTPNPAPSASAGERPEDLARYIRDERRRHVRLSTGSYAHQCFTDDDLRKFRAARTAKNVAQAAKRSPRFRAIVAALVALSVGRRRALLSDAALLAHPTWEELGRIATDGSGQTLAGAAAEREISAALVDAAEEILADSDHSGRKQ